MIKKGTVLWVSYPIIKALIVFVLGILMSFWVSINLDLLYLVCFFLFVFTSLSFLKSSSIPLNQFLIFSLLFSSGMLRTESKRQHFSEQFQEIGRLNQSTDSLLIFGEIQSSKSTERSVSYDILVDSLSSNSHFQSSKPFLCRVLFYPDKKTGFQEFQQNTSVTFWVKPKPISLPRNPYQFDYTAFLISREIVAQYELLQVVKSAASTGIDAIKPLFEKSLENIFSGSNSAIAKALILGDKTDINPEQRQAFTRSGLAHLMAVSGLHVGFLVAPFWFLIPWLWTKKNGRITGLLLLGLGLFFYAWLTGFSASVVRASIMALLFSYAKLFERVRYPMNIVGAAALFLLIINPNYIFDVGFQLSFGAVSIILLILPTFSTLVQKQTWPYKILSSMLVGIVVQVGLAPILALYFGEISIISPISNIIAMFPASALVLLGLCFTIIGIPFPTFAHWFSVPLNFLATTLQYFAEVFSSTDFSFVKISQPNMFFFLFWMGFLAFIASWTHGKMRWSWLVFTFVSLLAWRSEIMIQSFETKPMQITVVDVGQGDANIIETPDGKIILIDTGVWSPNYNSGNQTLVPLLKAKGISQIHTLVLTHPHADHIGGTVPILQQFSVDTLYTYIPEENEQSSVFKRILATTQKLSIPVKSLVSGNYLWIGNYVNARVLWPVDNFSSNNTNELSTILRLDYGKTSFLFTGDAEHEAEEILSTIGNEILDTDYLKVGHHGSKSSSSIPFLDDVTPIFASVSLAKKNKYRHPHAESTFRIESFTKKIHFTSLDGAAIYESDGKQIWKLNWRDSYSH